MPRFIYLVADNKQLNKYCSSPEEAAKQVITACTVSEKIVISEFNLSKEIKKIILNKAMYIFHCRITKFILFG